MGVSGKGKKEKEEPKKEKKQEKKVVVEEEEEEEELPEEEPELDGLSVHSPCKPAPSSSIQKEKSEVELELKLLESLEIYPPAKLCGVHRHFVLYGLTEFLKKSLNREFTSDEVLKLLERFYNLDMLKPDEEDAEILNHEEDFSLPQSYFDKDDS